MNITPPLPTTPVRPMVYARFLGISTPTVRSLARRGLIASLVTPSGQIRVLPEAFQDALAARSHPVGAA